MIYDLKSSGSFRAHAEAVWTRRDDLYRVQNLAVYNQIFAEVNSSSFSLGIAAGADSASVSFQALVADDFSGPNFVPQLEALTRESGYMTDVFASFDFEEDVFDDFVGIGNIYYDQPQSGDGG